jgi:hypothetical protein
LLRWRTVTDDAEEGQPTLALAGTLGVLAAYGLLAVGLLAEVGDRWLGALYWGSLLAAALAVLAGLLHRRRGVKLPLVLGGLLYLVLVGGATLG